MVAPEVADDNLGIDWEHLLENLPDDLNFDFPDRPCGEGLSDTPDSGCCLSIDDIEQYLVNDEPGFTEEEVRIDVEDAFFSDVFLDLLPASGSDRSKEPSSSPESIDGGTDEDDKEEDKSREDGGDAQQVEEKNDVAEDSDPDAKKRKRQLSNRDAAMRSRERKKMYVSDLEKKSKFYEAECKRLGILLQCCLAENQALKLSLHSSKAFDASMAKQESAVLLLESLLLGSLLGFPGIICLLLLLSSHLQSAVLMRNADSGEWRSRAPRRGQNEVSNILFHHSYMMMGKRCKASRTRMKEDKCRVSIFPPRQQQRLSSKKGVRSASSNSQVNMDSDYGVPRELSDLQKLRSHYKPDLPPCLQGTTVRLELGDATTTADPTGAHIISRAFPHTYGQPLAHFLRATAKVPDAHVITEHPVVRVGVVFCGRQSPGGHNVIWGLLEALKVHNPESVLLGFLGGSQGLFAQKTLEVTDEILATYKNQGGYDLLGRTQDQIRTTEQVNAALNACTSLKLDALVIIGGVTSNTDAAQLAETFAERKCPTKVVGMPVTLNGDLKNQFVETNVGFDTICKVNSQLISNVCTDALSAEKYYYFIRLMGRKASHVALECTLQSHPNMVILAEEVAASKLTLFDITKQICDAVQARAGQDKYHGVILLPEGLIESIPEVYALLKEIHDLLRQGISADSISSQLSPWASALFEFLPPFIRNQLLLHPESDDSAQLSQIETEKLLAHLVEAEMNKRSKEGTYKGKKFNAICHFFGYQARGSLPSKFDCDYAYVLGHVAYHIIAAGLNGYMATITNLKNPVNKWRCGAAPITAMLTVRRYGHGHGATTIGKPMLYPANVDLKGKAYELLRQNATKFLIDDVYRNPGPLQFEGPGADAKPLTLCVEDQDYMGRIKQLREHLDKVRSIVKPGCSQDVLKAALSAMASVTDILSVMSSPSGGINPF